jgi:hypothetical protein
LISYQVSYPIFHTSRQSLYRYFCKGEILRNPYLTDTLNNTSRVDLANWLPSQGVFCYVKK